MGLTNEALKARHLEEYGASLMNDSSLFLMLGAFLSVFLLLGLPLVIYGICMIVSGRRLSFEGRKMNEEAGRPRLLRSSPHPTDLVGDGLYPMQVKSVNGDLTDLMRKAKTFGKVYWLAWVPVVALLLAAWN